MAKTSARRSFNFSRVAYCKIHPGIGIARVGNSAHPDGYFIGPECPVDPRDVTVPPGGFKDAEGKVKRQAARFRIYAYGKDGKVLGELPLQGPGDRKGTKAEVEWTVHLKNKKGAWYKFFRRDEDPAKVEIRNSDIEVDEGRPDEPPERQQLVIDPRPRCITGQGTPRDKSKDKPAEFATDIPESLLFDTGSFRGTPVPLGELKIDERGRLLVLGGSGKSGSTRPDNPIGANPQDFDFWANNDFWYDDISDGPITATVTLPNGRSLTIRDPKDAAWVIVAPPKYAPGVYPIVTLYDLIREVIRERNAHAGKAAKWQWHDIPHDVEYYRDIHPILSRAADTAWVNNQARRGHGYHKQGDFRRPDRKEAPKTKADLLTSELLGLPDATQDEDEPSRREARARVFARIRNPALAQNPKTARAKQQATSTFMPPLSGDGGDATKGEFATWLTILPSQYRKFEQWKDGHFASGKPETFPSLDEMTPEQQVVALQRAALEPCVGGALHPGIEMSWIAKESGLYADAFRINSNANNPGDPHKCGPGDLTKYMCLPWQADFYECVNNWWPAARPDDVIPEADFLEVDAAWQPGQPQVAEGLERREKWDRGLGVTTLFRRPWNNPASAADDPRDSDRRGCDDMVRYWHELGFVVPRITKWSGGSSKQREIVQVETQRRPYAGMDVRDLFHCLLNMEDHREARPKVKEFVENVLAAARQVQQRTDAFAAMDNIRPFRYEEAALQQRMEDIYDDCADFAFTKDANGISVPYDVNDPEHNPFFRTRENVIERVRQLAPFNFLDGSWLRNVHQLGPVDEVNATLFAIFKEELGDGVASQNHANLYRDLCHSFGFYPPPVASTAFARDPNFLDAAFDSATFQLAISEFTTTYYPEIIGMTLWLEWTCLDLHRISQMVEKAGLSAHFYRMHIAIDNASSGHGAQILRAVKLYLGKVRQEGGERAVQEHWRRIWDGYVAFQHTFAILIDQVIAVVSNPPSLEDRLVQLVEKKKPWGEYNHGTRRLGGSEINALFNQPWDFLQALVDEGYIVPGQPDRSRFFKALEFDGRMYRVFTQDEIKLWHDWTMELGLGKKHKLDKRLATLRSRLTLTDADLAPLFSDSELAVWQQATSDHRITLWLELASRDVAAKAEAMRAKAKAEPDMHTLRMRARDKIRARFKSWLGWSMIRAVTHIAAQHPTIFDRHPLSLRDVGSKQVLHLSKWLEKIREAQNGAELARSFIIALSDALPKQDPLGFFRKDGPWTYALKSTVPGNDGSRARATLEAWIKAGFPYPHRVPKERVKPLRIDASLTEQESHPTGLSVGFGTVH
jgi:hypothetical protein